MSIIRLQSKPHAEVAPRTNTRSWQRLLAKTCATLVLACVGLQSASAVDKLTVSGSKILVGGQEDPMAGNSFFWTNNGWGGERYYTKGAVQKLKSDWNTRIVRAAMGVDEGNGHYLDDPAANVARVKTIVDAAIDENLYVIIDWHSHHAENYKAQAIDFFEDMANTYGNTNNVIYEIYNEPLNNVSWDNTIKPYAEDVIAAIRAIDPDNLIVVGTPTWSQDVDKAAANPITGYANIAYALHFYAGTHKAWLRDRAERAMNDGIALMVTEWGSVDASGNGAIDKTETDRWVAWMKQYDIHHLNWSVNDKNETASILKPGAATNGNWTLSDYTENGRYIRDIVRAYNDGSGNGGGGGGGGGNTAPNVSFSNPSGNLTVDEGYDLVVVANASDSDGSISELRLYINGNFVRRERYAPYEWGHDGSPAPNEVNGLGVGTHTFRVEAEDNGGRTSSDTFTLTVRSNNGGGGGGGTGNCYAYTGSSRVELDLSQNGNCVTFSGGLNGKTVQVWDSDTNSSCDFRGTVSSADGSGSLNINSNYKSSNGFTGSTLNFAASNGCKFVKIRRY